MRLIRMLCVISMLFFANDGLSADVPTLKAGVHIQNGGGDLTVDKYSTPTTVDWNNDGKRDLLCGQYTDGRVWLFLNQGTDMNPMFNGGALVESAGVPITTPYG